MKNYRYMYHLRKCHYDDRLCMKLFFSVLPYTVILQKEMYFYSSGVATSENCTHFFPYQAEVDGSCHTSPGGVPPIALSSGTNVSSVLLTLLGTVVYSIEPSIVVITLTIFVLGYEYCEDGCKWKH